MKSITGKVISNKMEKTVVVAVESKWQHPLYKKTVKRTKHYLAHDEFNTETGKEVSIVEIRPMSKRKKWKVISESEAKSNK